MNKFVSFIISLACGVLLYNQPLFACDIDHILKRDADSSPESERPHKRPRHVITNFPLAQQTIPGPQQGMEVEEQVDWKQLYHDAQQRIEQQNQQLEYAREKIESLFISIGKSLWVGRLDDNFDELRMDNSNLTCFPFCACVIDPVNGGALILAQNRIKNLPECIGSHSISILDLSSNELKDLPRSFGKIKGLSYLYLSCNNLESVPDCLIECQGLETLYLRHNPLISSIYNDIDLNFVDDDERIQCFLKFDRAKKDSQLLFNIFLMLPEILPLELVVVICRINHNRNLEYISATSWDDVNDYYLKAKKVDHPLPTDQ